MDEIVRRLRASSKKTSISIKESLLNSRLSEAEDEEDTTMEEEIPTKDTEEVEIPAEEEEVDTEPSEEDEYVDPDGDTESENKEEEDTEEDSNEYVNPLDNPYAVKHTIGEEVVLAYSNGTTSKLKGEIDGYDKEGFYRILWSNGLTTDGITDLALADIVKSTNESVCVCGNSEFVTEGKHVVCDNCGRKIREAKEDPLTLADKKRPEGKRMIRSEAHPMSTSISETIKNAFKKPMNESKIPVEFADLVSELRGRFWTRQSEMKEDIEELDYIVEEINGEYVIISTEDEDESYTIQVPIVGTSRTMTLDFDKARSA